MTQRQDIVVGGILIIDGQILLIRRAAEEQSSPGYWEIPKGKVEFGEDQISALRREFLEEVNLKIELGEVLDVHSHKYSRDGIDVHFWEIDFSVELSSNEKIGNLKLSPDHDDWKIVGLANIHNLVPMYEDRRAKYISILRELAN
jgi:8-oxo-dGTP diphosphatase